MSDVDFRIGNIRVAWPDNNKRYLVSKGGLDLSLTTEEMEALFRILKIVFTRQ